MSIHFDWWSISYLDSVNSQQAEMSNQLGVTYWQNRLACYDLVLE